jgi:hypothetical protein
MYSPYRPDAKPRGDSDRIEPSRPRVGAPAIPEAGYSLEGADASTRQVSKGTPSRSAPRPAIFVAADLERLNRPTPASRLEAEKEALRRRASGRYSL